ncbi:hypothetical protein EAG_09800 [Camponotus floridanus]|uniref:Uncharacterized protein n=1 Tax=Camponotus floridanus TaxID=104421 RepID=E2AUS9_CAMFO|nr:hypothetical protein EAG_09800 [Camponotus floridanus]
MDDIAYAARDEFSIHLMLRVITFFALAGIVAPRINWNEECRSKVTPGLAESIVYRVGIHYHVHPYSHGNVSRSGKGFFRYKEPHTEPYKEVGLPLVLSARRLLSTTDGHPMGNTCCIQRRIRYTYFPHEKKKTSRCAPWPFCLKKDRAERVIEECVCNICTSFDVSKTLEMDICRKARARVLVFSQLARISHEMHPKDASPGLRDKRHLGDECSPRRCDKSASLVSGFFPWTMDFGLHLPVLGPTRTIELLFINQAIRIHLVPLISSSLLYSPADILLLYEMYNLGADASLHLDKEKFLIKHSININHLFYCSMVDIIERSTRRVNFSTAIIQSPTWENGLPLTVRLALVSLPSIVSSYIGNGYRIGGEEILMRSMSASIIFALLSFSTKDIESMECFSHQQLVLSFLMVQEFIQIIIPHSGGERKTETGRGGR